MAHNLLLDTDFNHQRWKFNKCKYIDGCIISEYKVFGIEQELTLPDITKLYFRCSYLIIDDSIKEVKIAIQNGNILNIDRRFPKTNKWNTISVIDKSMQEKIKVHVIFESSKDVNKVFIKEPILVDLNAENKSTWLKIILDRTIKYQPGYTYSNMYKQTLLTLDNNDFNNCIKEKAKIGLMINECENKNILLDAKFIVNRYYLAKLDFEEVNQYGEIYFKYGALISNKVNEQLYLLFKGKVNEQLYLNIDVKEALPYKLNIKNLMIIDITDLKLLKSDVINLPYI